MTRRSYRPAVVQPRRPPRRTLVSKAAATAAMDEPVSRIILPIDGRLPDVAASLRKSPVLVLQAPPGAGKTTRVPIALLEAGLLGDQQQLVLVQPRRLAARAAAARMAEENHWTLGRECGYHVRFDRRASSETRILAVTDGVLLRRLQQDPVLADVSAVVLDEFHERRLDTDVLLGMLHRLRTELRPELRLVVMSATLDAATVAQFLSCPVITAEGRSFPVRIRYRPPVAATSVTSRRIAEQAAHAVRDCLPTCQGDLLVFLPGEGEIRQVHRLLERETRTPDWIVLPLYGRLSPQEQDRVLRPNALRKIVLATNVAETSVTIDGVTTVVDSGWARVLRYDPQVGLDRLQLERISQASAEQRSGRAGRTAPGVCCRLWSEAAERGRPAQTEPEIQRVDLSGAVLQLHAWGERDIDDFPWLQAPRSESVADAHRILRMLGSLDDQLQITIAGRAMSRLPAHPRIAKLLLVGQEMDVLYAASWAAAILAERDPIQRREDQRRGAAEGGDARKPPTLAAAVSDCDLCDRIAAVWRFLFSGEDAAGAGRVNHAAARHLARIARQFRDLVRAELRRPRPAATQADEALPDTFATEHRELLRRALLAAFPDRLARRRDPHQPRGLMVGGRGVRLSEESAVTHGDLFLCLDCVGADRQEARVRMASEIPRGWLPAEGLHFHDACFFHPSRKQVVARRQVCWQDLVLEESPLPAPSGEEVERLLYAKAVAHWDQVNPEQDADLRQLLARVAWLGEVMPELDWPKVDRELLLELLREMCVGRRSFEQLRKASWRDAMLARLDARQHEALRQDAPTRLQTPRGTFAKVQYELGKPPVAAVRIQEAFGWADTPRLARGRRKILLHLLAPNMRCQQITDDLASFWDNAYHVVRRELKRRYPKHAWPEDPRGGA